MAKRKVGDSCQFVFPAGKETLSQVLGTVLQQDHRVLSVQAIFSSTTCASSLEKVHTNRLQKWCTCSCCVALQPHTTSAQLLFFLVTFSVWGWKTRLNLSPSAKFEKETPYRCLDLARSSNQAPFSSNFVQLPCHFADRSSFLQTLFT